MYVVHIPITFNTVDLKIPRSTSPQPSPALITGIHCWCVRAYHGPSSSSPSQHADIFIRSIASPKHTTDLDQPIASIPRSLAFFSSGRVEVVPTIDRAAPKAQIDDLYDCLDSQQDVRDNYNSLYGALHAQEIRCDRLEQEIQADRELAGSFAKFVSQRCNSLRYQFQDATRLTKDYRKEIRVISSNNCKIYRTCVSLCS